MAEIKVLVNGAAGKMGRAMSAGIAKESDMKIVAAVDFKFTGNDLGLACGIDSLNVNIEEDLAAAISRTKPDVMVDFTNPQAVMKNIRIAVPQKVACVVGTTGLSQNDLQELDKLANEYNTPVFCASNFALGAVLMMRFAKEAAVYFPNVEVIERHHDQKLDAPSGTAITTLEMINDVREVFSQGAANEFEKIPSSRGGDYAGMRVHSVRLPGYVATQEVIFGSLGQILTIRHDAMSRECFLPGVLMAIRKIGALSGLVFGLEKII